MRNSNSEFRVGGGGAKGAMILTQPLTGADPGSRIPRRTGRQPSGGGGGGAPTYDIAKFSEKLHEIEKISAPTAPP